MHPIHWSQASYVGLHYCLGRPSMGKTWSKLESLIQFIKLYYCISKGEGGSEDRQFQLKTGELDFSNF